MNQVQPEKCNHRCPNNLETATTATTLAASRVGGSGGNVLNAADLHAGAGKGTESGLGTGAGSLGTVTTSGTDLDVEGSDAELLAAGRNVLSSQHGSVGRGLITIGLDLHTTGNTADGFAATQIGDVDEGVVERGEDSRNAKDKFTLANLGAEGDVLLGRTGDLLGGHFDW